MVGLDMGILDSIFFFCTIMDKNYLYTDVVRLDN
jgi:hypothetical protein